MKNLLMQLWKGPTLNEEARTSSKLMKAYAKRIGAEYKLFRDTTFADKLSDDPLYYEWLGVMFDEEQEKYDKICQVDLDIFPVENLEESIFDVDIGEFGVCQEPFQGKQRATVTVGGGINMMNDERWASAVSKKYGSKLPRDDEGYLKAFNAGMTILTREGIQKAKHTWGAIQEYINYIRNKGIPRFYTYDQNYMLSQFTSTDTDWKVMPDGWNSQIHYVRGPMSMTMPINDERTDDTKFVHVQMTGHKWDEKGLYEIVNLPQGKWSFM